MASGVIHGRDGILYLSTSSGSTAYGEELGYVDEWSLEPSREVSEVTKINSSSIEYLEGLVSATMSASGHSRVGDTNLKRLINRFAKVVTHSTDGETTDEIADGNLYFHLFLKPIDTAATGDDIAGAKYVAPALSNGFSQSVPSGDVEGWTYSGTINGNLEYHESTSTEDGFPKASA